MICPSCPAQPLALFICDDGVHRCYACKSARPISTRFPLQPRKDFKPTPGPAQGSEYRSPYTSHKNNQRRTRLDSTRVIAELRRKQRDIESRANWRESDRFSSAHYAYAQAIQIVRDVDNKAPG